MLCSTVSMWLTSFSQLPGGGLHAFSMGEGAFLVRFELLADLPLSLFTGAPLLRFVPLEDFSGRPPMSSKYSLITSAAVSLPCISLHARIA